MAVASGQSAITALLNIVQAGDEIVSADSLYGGTYNLFIILSRLGIKVNFVPSNDLAALESNYFKTKAVYASQLEILS